MSPAPVGSHILQSLDVVLHNLARIVLDRHGRQLGRQLDHRFGGERFDALSREDGIFGHDAFGGLRAEGEEGGESFLFTPRQ